MSALLASAQRSYDRAEPQDMTAEDWEPVIKEVTDAEVEEFINGLAATGAIEDRFGYSIRQSDLHRAVAAQWRTDKEAVGPIVGGAFWKWARAAAYNAKFGI